MIMTRRKYCLIGKKLSRKEEIKVVRKKERKKRNSGTESSILSESGEGAKNEELLIERERDRGVRESKARKD